MTRNQATTAGNLKTGDRFYKASDKGKTSLQIVAKEAYATKHRTYHVFCCPAVVMDNPVMKEKEKLSQASGIMSNTEVIYLRNINN